MLWPNTASWCSCCDSAEEQRSKEKALELEIDQDEAEAVVADEFSPISLGSWPISDDDRAPQNNDQHRIGSPSTVTSTAPPPQRVNAEHDEGWKLTRRPTRFTTPESELHDRLASSWP
mmetsp:Transcript_14988/g.12744  ORF Transcript_14988/g.12744 Transcript_14988/m.12744 type:complete len:118 (+) Transcript_14988:56-409(+)